MLLSFKDDIFAKISDLESRSITGRVRSAMNGIIRCELPNAKLGSIVKILPPGEDAVYAEVVGFQENDTLLMPISSDEGIRAGSKVYVYQNRPLLEVGMSMIGKILDGYGRDLHTREFYQGDKRLIHPEPVPATVRYPIHKPLDMGVRSFNGLLTVGEGQRIGIFAGAGVGKSTLLGMIARNVKCDVNVIALVGERGRELREFLEKDLGPEGMKRSVVVVATSDACAIERIRAAYSALTIAEYFRDQGLSVLLTMDSLTRFAMSKREISLRLGEPSTTKGYTPSVFAEMPKLIERCGTYEGRGSITGIFTVLVEGDDMEDPIADAAKGLLDGHIVLNRSLAMRGIYPPIDPTQSLSRVMDQIVDKQQVMSARKFRALMVTLKDNEDLIRIGAYRSGNDPVLDEAISKKDLIENYLKQAVNEKEDLAESLNKLIRIARS